MQLRVHGWRRLALWIIAPPALFVLGVIAEAEIRSLARRPISIAVEGKAKADVKGYVQPDLLWLGEQWCVSVDSDDPIEVEFEGQWKANVPAGKHAIYHNHDSNNTTEYATSRRWEPPTSVVVRSGLPENSDGAQAR